MADTTTTTNKTPTAPVASASTTSATTTPKVDSKGANQASVESKVEGKPNTTTDSKTEPKPNPTPQKYKIKVDGKEVEATLEDLQKAYSKVAGADKRFQEGAQARKQAEDFVRMLQNDPLKILTHPSLGLNFRELAENYLVEQLKEAQLSPEQRELKAAKAQLKAVEDQKKLDEQKALEAQQKQLEAHYTQEYTKSIISALETAQLPKTPSTVKRMAYYMSQSLQRNLDLKPADVVDLVRKDYIAEQKELFGGLDGDMLLQLLGEDTAKKIRKSDLARIKKAQKETTISTKPNSTTTTKKTDNKISTKQFKELIRKKVENQ